MLPPMANIRSRPQKVEEGSRHHFGRLLKIRQSQLLICPVSVRVFDRLRTGTIEHNGDARFGVVARIGVEWNPYRADGVTKDELAVAAQPLG